MISVNSDAKCPYMVGDLYYTTREGNPAQTWPGTTWQAIQDCFVRGADASHPAGSTGGSWTHTQTEAEMFRHAHGTRIGWTDSATGGLKAEYVDSSNLILDKGSETYGVGGGQPMDITNPYYSAYIWRRTG